MRAAMETRTICVGVVPGHRRGGRWVTPRCEWPAGCRARQTHFVEVAYVGHYVYQVHSSRFLCRHHAQADAE